MSAIIISKIISLISFYQKQKPTCQILYSEGCQVELVETGLITK